jgi:hypothetical protein
MLWTTIDTKKARMETPYLALKKAKMEVSKD